MSCELCKYSRPIEGDVEVLTDMIAAYNVSLQKEYEDQAKINPLGRSYAMASHYSILLCGYEDKLKSINNNVMCYRFPRSIEKRKIDFCGEFIKYE